MATINENISDEMLVSYADGELNEADRRVVEEAIAENQLLRAKLERYEESANLLKKTLASSEQATPDHVLHRIKQIEEKASRQANIEKGSWGLSSLLEYLQPRYAGPALATFAFGLILGPSLMPMLGTDESQYPVSDLDITLRGAFSEVIESQIVGNDLLENLNVRLIQEGRGIQAGDAVDPAEPFSIIFLSPIDGAATLQLLADGQNGADLASVSISVGRYATFEEVQLGEGQLPEFRIIMNGDEIQLVRSLSFTLSN